METNSKTTPQQCGRSSGTSPATSNTDKQQQSCSISSKPIGAVEFGPGEITYNAGRKVTTLRVRNTGDRPIQVGSHFHFFEANRLLDFERDKAFGCHLNIPATTAVRFEPGEEKSVEVVPYGGKRRTIGFGGLVGGSANPSLPYAPTYHKALGKLLKRGYLTTKTK